MNRIPTHTHSMEIEFSAKGYLLFRATIPLKLRAVVNISKFYKSTKEGVALWNNIPQDSIKGKHQKIKSVLKDRVLFEWPGGVSLDIPDNCGVIDYKIILHYLEGIKMAKGF